MKIISKNKLKLIAMREVAKANPGATASQLKELISERMGYYAEILKEL